MSRKNSYEDVKNAFEERGYTLVDEVYENTHRRMNYICPSHPDKLQMISFASLKSGRGCKECGKEKIGSKHRFSLDEVEELFASFGYEIFDIENLDYKNTSQRIRVICPNHKDNIVMLSVDSLKAGKSCKYCGVENRSGENHYRWIGGKEAYDDRYRNSNDYKEWRLSVYSRDGFSCRRCNRAKVQLNAHHILNFYKFKDLRYEISNGITFCEKCHREFHKKYGLFQNNENQVKEFLNKEIDDEKL